MKTNREQDYFINKVIVKTTLKNQPEQTTSEQGWLKLHSLLWWMTIKSKQEILG